MSSYLVSYATGRYVQSQRGLIESAREHGVDHARPLGRRSLKQTPFYRLHRPILDQPRGAGYWLWKPFIVNQTLKEMRDGDILIYSDAGIEIVAGLTPLLDLAARQEIVLFDGRHYDDAGAPGPNRCAKWTKRDCFVALECDEPRYHDAPVLDASFTVFAKSARSVRFAQEWLLYCCQPHALTDQPNRCGLPNLPSFIDHRHDQSILSLLAARDRLELFRHPSQLSNHFKPKSFREPGEFHRLPYGSKGIMRNSAYPTLLNHHRGRQPG